MATETVDIAVVGAGPTGLALALTAVAHGATVRLLDRRLDPVRPSKALIMHARTLEVLRPLEVSEALLGRGDPTPTAQIHLRGRVLDAPLGHLELPGTPFPNLLLVAQAEVEHVLSTELERRGVTVERGTDVSTVRLSADTADVATRRGKTIAARFVAGCDGPASVVRHALGASWNGGYHAEEVVLADVELDGDLDPARLHAAPGPLGLVFLFALGERATWRLLATRPAPPGPRHEHGALRDPVDPDELDGLLAQAGILATVDAVPWSASIALEHRLASAFRNGRGFVAGDAAHAHSPAGGLGMNTGIQDAANLGWKLAFAARSDTPSEQLLASYAHERRRAARRVVALSRAIFWAEASARPGARVTRRAIGRFGPSALPLLLRRHRLLASGFTTLGQLHLHHRRSPISGPRRGRFSGLPTPGDRLPDGPATTHSGTTTLHALTARPGVHLLVQGDDAWTPPARSPWLSVHRLGGQGTGVSAIRPDGLAGYTGDRADRTPLCEWIERVCVPLDA